MCGNNVFISNGGNEMKEASKHCINCLNLKHTGEFVCYTPVYTCDIIRGVVDPTNYCNNFQEIIPLSKKPVPSINDPSTEWLRGFNDYGITYIKTKKGEIISI